MIRVSSGTARHLKLKTPDTPEFRAVQEVAKQAVFNIIGKDIINKICLDLFAGSGNIGIEALSRGAKYCDFVDKDKRATRVIEENLEKTGFSDRGEVIRSDSIKYVANTPEKYDFVFSDPYYNDTSHIFLFKNMQEVLQEHGLIIFFHGGKLDLEKTIENTRLHIIDSRKFGRSFFSIVEHLPLS
jgi:16S rRNA (guanine966-N2)-methyltransferase